MADCCRIEWQDGTVLAFTTHDEALVIEAETYTPVPGIQPFAIQTHSGMAVDNTDVAGIIDDDTIKETDIEDGLWDFAEVRFFQVNWQALDAGQLKLRRGWVGEIKAARTLYIAEIRGLMQALVREIGKLYTPDCPYDLGDSDCGVDLGPFTVTGTVTAAGTDGRHLRGDTLVGSATDYFAHGVLTFLTGQNAGRRMEVQNSDTAGNVYLFLPMRHAIQVGDTFSVYGGCSKSFTDCEVKFSNWLRFGGYPTVPNESLLLYPDSHT